MSAMRAEDNVLRFQIGTNTHRYGLLPDIRVASSGHQSALVGLNQVLLRAADRHHAFVKRQGDSPGWQFDGFRIF